MIGFITDNIGTIIVSLILIAVCVAAVRSIIKGKKKGQCSCGGNCGSCPGCSAKKTE